MVLLCVILLHLLLLAGARLGHTQNPSANDEDAVSAFCKRLPGVKSGPASRNSSHYSAWVAPAAETSVFEREYSLTDSLLANFTTSGTWSPAFLKKLAEGHHASAVVLGGSFTRGHGCGENPQQDEHACSWPSRLAAWWRSEFGHALVWQNLAEHGSSSEIFAQRVGALLRGTAKADLVVIETLVNDAAEHAGPGATVAYEVLIRSVKTLLPEAQILLVEAGCPACVECPSCHKTRQVRRSLAEHYSLPSVDYTGLVLRERERKRHILKTEKRTAADTLWPFQGPEMKYPYVVLGARWPDFSPPVNVTHVTCCPQNHPPWPVHVLVADAAAYTIRQALHAACNASNLPGFSHNSSMVAPFHSHIALDVYPVCLHPLSRHSALDMHSRKNASSAGTGDVQVLRGDWKLFADRPERPGWISTASDSLISFPVKFGRAALLTITYMKSYGHGWGSASVKLIGPFQSGNIHGAFVNKSAHRNEELRRHFRSATKFPPHVRFIGEFVAHDGSMAKIKDEIKFANYSHNGGLHFLFLTYASVSSRLCSLKIAGKLVGNVASGVTKDINSAETFREGVFDLGPAGTTTIAFKAHEYLPHLLEFRFEPLRARTKPEGAVQPSLGGHTEPLEAKWKKHVSLPTTAIYLGRGGHIDTDHLFGTLTKQYERGTLLEQLSFDLHIETRQGKFKIISVASC